MAYGDATNFLGSLTVNGVPVALGVTGSLPMLGNVYYVNETTGSDGNLGTGDSPFATLSYALSQCTANQNDCVVFEGTIHLTATLTWSKNQVHLIGSCSPLMRGKRARISSSGSTVFSPMVSVTASGCLFQNFGTFYGYNDASAQICWQDTGGRNTYNLVEFMGFGDATAAAQTGSRAFKFNTNTGESTFRNCVFGVDTVARTAANYTLEIAGNAPRMYFYGCHFESYLTGSGANACHLLIGSAGIDRYLKFEDCVFSAETASGGSVAMTQAFNVSASAGGYVLCKDSWFFGCTNAETSASGVVYMTMPAVATADSGLSVVNAPS